VGAIVKIRDPEVKMIAKKLAPIVDHKPKETMKALGWTDDADVNPNLVLQLKNATESIHAKEENLFSRENMPPFAPYLIGKLEIPKKIPQLISCINCEVLWNAMCIPSVNRDRFSTLLDTIVNIERFTSSKGFN
jgi:hypothetical protein